MKEIYLVIEFESRIIYLPFKDLESVDNFTVCFDNLLELAASINDYLSLNIPNDEILDVYLSEDIDKIYDDNQEYNKRYLAVKYRRDNYDKSDLEKTFMTYLKYGIKKINEHSGLKNVIDNYEDKHVKNKKASLEDKDMEKIALLYLGNDYKRHKECFFKLKDKGYKIRINIPKIDYSNPKKLEEEDKMLLTMFTGMNIEELKTYVLSQNENRRKL